MADTRRGSRYHVLPLNFQDSHYANVPPITDPPRRLLPPCTFSQSLPIGIMQTVDAKISNISTHATVDRRKEGRKEISWIFDRGRNTRWEDKLQVSREREREGRQVFWSRVNEPVLRINLTILRLRMGQMKESCCIEQGSFAPLKRLQRPIGIFNRVLGGMGEETLFSIPWRGQTLSRSLSLWGSARSERLAIRCPLWTLWSSPRERKRPCAKLGRGVSFFTRSFFPSFLSFYARPAEGKLKYENPSPFYISIFYSFLLKILNDWYVERF